VLDEVSRGDPGVELVAAEEVVVDAVAPAWWRTPTAPAAAAAA
jgi:hypothetical protein